MRLPVIAVVASLAACASAPQGATRDLVSGIGAERPATRAQLARGDAGSFLRRAAAVLQREGLRIAVQTPTQVVTAPRERDGRCGVGPCRVRELVMVNLSGQAVRLELVRAVRGPSDPQWRMEADREAIAETASREARLLEEMLGDLPARLVLSQR